MAKTTGIIITVESWKGPGYHRRQAVREILVQVEVTQENCTALAEAFAVLVRKHFEDAKGDGE